MTVKWERFTGSTDIFAVRIAFTPDPDVGAAADPEESVSWGSFQLWARGQNLCAHVDQGEVLQSAHWYILPLLEWLADNWNALLHEEKLPNRNSADTAVDALSSTRFAPVLAGEAETIAWESERYEWRERHALRAARSGGLFPNVVIRRLRDLIEISWDDEPAAGTPRDFRQSSASGAALFYPRQVAEPLYEMIHAAAEYLGDFEYNDGRVARLRRKIPSLALPAQRDQRLNWLAGLRELPPLSGRLQGKVSLREMNQRWFEIVDALKDAGGNGAAEAALAIEESPLVVIGSCHAALLFSSMSPTVTAEDVRTLATVLVEQYTEGAVSSALDDLAEEVPFDRTIPAWEHGYELAEAVYSELSVDDSECWVDIEGLLRTLGITVLTRKLEDDNIRACSIIGPNHVPTVILNESSSFYGSPHAQRFSLAHELCHLLFDRSHGQKVALASGPWAPKDIERRANAFAAMFLMPTTIVERVVADGPDPIDDMAGVATVASKLRVSRRAAIDHLYNLTIMSDSVRDKLLREVRD